MKTEELLEGINTSCRFRMIVPCLDDLYKLDDIDDNVNTGDIIIVNETGDEYMLVNPVYINSSRGWSLISQTESNSMTITSPSSPAYLKNNDWETSTISTGEVTLSDSINDLESEIKMLKENMTRQLNITMLHGCRNCGARVDVDINKPVFHCKYCGTSYIIGTVQMNSTY